MLFSGHGAGSLGAGVVGRCVGSPPRRPSSPSSAGGMAQKKRSGTTLPMPGRKPASRLWSRKASASPTAACSSLPAASSEASAADSVSPAPTKRGVEALELLAGERALRRRQHVVDELFVALGGQHHAGDEHVARAVFAGGHRQLARRRRALAVPVGQQEVGQRLVVAHQHLGGRQDQLAKGVEIGLQLVLVEPAQGGHVATPAARRGSRTAPRPPRSPFRPCRGSRPSSRPA